MAPTLIVPDLKTLQVKQLKKSDSKYFHTVDLHYRNLEAAKKIVIETIKEFHSTEISRIKFITGRGNHVNSNGERAILYRNFPKWMTDIAIYRLVERYEKCNGHYLVILKSYRIISVPTVELQCHELQSAKRLTIRKIQEFHSREIFVIRFVTGREKHYENFPEWISNIMINHLIKFHVQYDGYYYISLKSFDQLENEIADTFFNVNFIRQEALNGDAEAQLILGLMYLDGEGVKKDIKEALKWLIRSEENGNTDAQLFIERLESELELVNEEAELVKEDVD